MSDVDTSQRTPIIFISCGQVTKEEKLLGDQVYSLVRELTSYKPYFAKNESTSDGVTENILGRINTCSGFIAIMHNRGTVSTPKAKHERASVWIEQEIAIVAFITQVLKKPLHIAAYTEKDIKREGMRKFLLLNPIEFESNDEIITNLKHRLPSWRLESIDAEPPALSLDIELEHQDMNIKSERHDYLLIVKLINSGSSKPTDWRVDVQFPSVFLNKHTVFAIEKPAPKPNKQHRLFSVTHREWSNVDLYPKDFHTVMTLPYFVDDENYDLVGKEEVLATVHSSNMPPREMRISMRSLQKF